MASDQYERSVIALAALELFPPLICESVISDHFFRKKYGLTADAQISFDSSGVSIQRSKLFKCIREVFTDSNSRHTLKDAAKEEWQLELIEKDNERRIVLSQGVRRLFLPDFSVFSSDQNERLVRFDLEAVEVNLPSQVLTHWREILSSRPLADDELDMLNTEIKETPIRVSALVRSDLRMEQAVFFSCSALSSIF